MDEGLPGLLIRLIGGSHGSGAQAPVRAWTLEDERAVCEWAPLRKTHNCIEFFLVTIRPATDATQGDDERPPQFRERILNSYGL